jgi:zinc protease
MAFHSVLRSRLGLLGLALGLASALALVPFVRLHADSPDIEAIQKANHALYDGIREESLPNGLKIYMKPIPNSPLVTVMTVYKVGSADEDLSQTGLSHYLEHLMFKGTEKLMPGEIDKMTRSVGGQNNAYTTQDFTCFHFDFPASDWQVALGIEADRMRNLRIDEKHEFEQEKDAVISELNGNEDEPWDLENKALLPILFGPKSPYGHPIIGQKAQVKAATAEIIKAHYDKWYHPNNACLVIVGGFDPDKAMARVKELFGPIPEAKLPERKQPTPIERKGPVSKEIPSKFDADRLVMGFNTGRVGEPEDYVFDVIQQVLSGGKTGRLYRRLVIDQEIAGEVNSSNQVNRLPGSFVIQLEVMKGKDRKKAEQALLHELKELAEKPVGEAELKRAKRSIIASNIFEREGVHELADAIVNTIAVTNFDYLKTYMSRLEAVTAKDIQEVAKKYLDPQKRVVVWSLPDNGEEAPKKKEPPKKPQRLRLRPQQKPAPAIKNMIDLRNVKRKVLDNGLTLLMLENHRLPIVFAEAYVKDVQLHEPKDKIGLAKLVGHLLAEGTDKHDEPQIAEIIESLGGQLATSSTGGSVKVLSPDWAKGMELLLECLTRSKFTRKSVERYKEHLQSEIEDEELKPNTKAEDTFLEMIYGDHPLGFPSNGKENTVENITPVDCREFHKKLFVPNNTILVVVGDFDSEAVVKEVTAWTKDWKQQELPKLKLPAIPTVKEFKEKIIPMPQTAQVNVYLGQLGIRRDNPDYYKLLVMDNILGTGPGFTDRLSSKLRDRMGLAYTVNANITSSAAEEPGVFSCFIGTYPDKFLDVKKLLLQEIDRIRTEKPSDTEVAEAKKYLLGSLPFRLATNENLGDQMITIERFGLGWDYLDKFPAKIASVTPEDVQEVARKYLDPKKMILVAAGPIDEKGQPVKEDGK